MVSIWTVNGYLCLGSIGWERSTTGCHQICSRSTKVAEGTLRFLDESRQKGAGSRHRNRNSFWEEIEIAAKVDRGDRDYFERKIRPLLAHPLIEFIDEIGASEKQEFLGNAAALLFPIEWPEPFGLVMIEAMACGTPVIAHPFGSVPEIIPDGVGGFLVRNVDEAVEAVNRIGEIDRRSCRHHFELNFTDERMARDNDAALPSKLFIRIVGLNDGRRGSFELDGSGIAHPQYYIATTSSPADDRARVLKYGRMFFGSTVWATCRPRAWARRACSMTECGTFLHCCLICGTHGHCC